MKFFGKSCFKKENTFIESVGVYLIRALVFEVYWFLSAGAPAMLFQVKVFLSHNKETTLIKEARFCELERVF